MTLSSVSKYLSQTTYTSSLQRPISRVVPRQFNEDPKFSPLPNLLLNLPRWGYLPSAKHTLSKIEQLRPSANENPIFLFLKGILFKQSNRPKKAITCLEASLRYFPGNILAHQVLAKTYLALNRFDKAKTHVQLAQHLAAISPNTVFLPEILKELENLEKTIETEEEAMSMINPNVIDTDPAFSSDPGSDSE